VITTRPISLAPAGYRFPREVIAVAVRWYLRYGLSYRDVEELLAERGITVDHVTIYRWVQTFTPGFVDAARPTRHTTGDRWFLDGVSLTSSPQPPATSSSNTPTTRWRPITADSRPGSGRCAA
jgi:transposase-like protein